jgi:membrane fusion protein (multidrug efflux system)
VASCRLIAGLGGLLCLAVLAAGCSGGTPNTVTVATAASGAIATDVGGLGTVSAAVAAPVALGFTDRVEDLFVGLGQQVKKGQPLLTLDPQPLLANEVQIRAHLGRVRIDLAHLRADLNDGSVSQALTPALLDQEQMLESQASLYGQLLAEALGQSSTLTAPIGGQVLAVNVLPGQVAKPSATLLEIVNYHRISVTAELPVSVQQEVKAGDSARLTFAAVPQLTITGIVTGVSPGSVNNGTGFLVTVDAPNTANQLVHPGYQAYVQVPYASSAGAIVRRMAVLNIGLAPSMFVVTGDTVQLRPVQVGAENGPDVQVVAGIQPGEEYVLVGNQNLANGDQVHVAGDLGPLGGQSG